jgi:hypothetical protein
MIDLYGKSLLAIVIAGLDGVLLSSEFGWQLGMRSGGRGLNNISALEQSTLGLLALIIGFTFAMSLSRFESRREAVLNEANTIGTTALRARLLPEPQRTESIRLLKEYVQIRIGNVQSRLSFAERSDLLKRSNEIQEELWQQTLALSAKNDAMVPTGLYIQTLNEMFDNQAKRLAALRNQIPPLVQLLLFGIVAIACAFAGYASALEKRRTRLPVYVVGTLALAVIIVILDLDRPNIGFITVSQQPMIDTAKSIAGY